jgi:hypothetical protein
VAESTVFATAFVALPDRFSAPLIRRHIATTTGRGALRIGQTVVDSDNTVHTRARKSKHFFCASAVRHRRITAHATRREHVSQVGAALASTPRTSEIGLVPHRLRDARCALRGMLRTPLLCTVAALSLAFGIAADTTIFSALDALPIRPLPTSRTCAAPTR